jgi:hypothetical protein
VQLNIFAIQILLITQLQILPPSKNTPGKIINTPAAASSPQSIPPGGGGPEGAESLLGGRVLLFVGISRPEMGSDRTLDRILYIALADTARNAPAVIVEALTAVAAMVETQKLAHDIGRTSTPLLGQAWECAHRSRFS